MADGSDGRTASATISVEVYGKFGLMSDMTVTVQASSHGIYMAEPS